MSEQENPLIRTPAFQAARADTSRNLFWLSAYSFLVLSFWTIVVIIFFWFGVGLLYSHATKMASCRANMVYDREYFLNDSASADILRSSPQIHTWNERGGVRSRVVSPGVTDPSLTPDTWERNALARLQKGVKRLQEIQYIEGIPYLRVMNEAKFIHRCELCSAGALHADGPPLIGVSLAAPMRPLWDDAHADIRRLAGLVFCLWATGAFMAAFGARSLAQRIKEREKAESELRKFTEELEVRVTERTRDMELRQRQLVSFMDNTNAGVYLKDPQYKFVLVNNRFANMLGTSVESLLGVDDSQFVFPETRAAVRQGEQTVMRERTSLDVETTLQLNGQKHPYNVLIFPILNAEKEIEGIGGIVMDIAQRKRMEQALLTAKEAAEAASRTKSDFLANISHEIRTPLNGVIGMADMLLRSALSPDQAAMAATIKSGGDSLLSVLNDILDFSKIEAGKIKLELLPFSLRDLAYDSIKSFAPAAYTKGLELLIHIPPDLPDFFVGDATRIRQILLNLVSNAIKFTEKGEISLTIRSVGVSEHGQTLRFLVRDTGIGVPPDKQKTIFRSFEQADTSTTRKYGGTGLGLAISSCLAGLMDSELRLNSEVGLGSTFWLDLCLPLASEGVVPRKPLAETGALAGKRVLVVDDNATNRQILIEQLLAWHVQAVESKSVDQALAALRKMAANEQGVQLVLSDLHMPGKDGVHLLRSMRDEPALKDIPLILLSSGDLPRSLPPELGCRANLTKPVRPGDLLQAMSAALDLWQERKEEGPKPAEEQKVLASGPSLRLLLAEDMEMNQMVAVRMLKDLGHEVCVVNNGQQALQAIMEEHFDIAFMDIQMPTLDGVQATQHLRELEARDPYRPYLPVIAMTAHAMKGDRDKYLASGMDGYVPKPLLQEDLAAAIKDIVLQFGLDSNDGGKEDAAPQAAPESPENAPADPPHGEPGDRAGDYRETGAAAGTVNDLAAQATGIADYISDYRGPGGAVDAPAASEDDLAAQATGIAGYISDYRGPGGAIDAPAASEDDLAAQATGIADYISDYRGPGGAVDAPADAKQHALPADEEPEAWEGEGAETFVEGPILDAQLLHDAFGVDSGFIRRAMELYLRDLPGFLSQIAEAIETGNNGMLASGAHTLKGSTSYYCRSAPYELVLALEMLGREEGLPTAGPKARRLYANLEKVLRALRAEMDIYIKKSQRT